MMVGEGTLPMMQNGQAVWMVDAGCRMVGYPDE